MKYSVIIPTCDAVGVDVKKCVDSVRRYSSDVEIILVANGAAHSVLNIGCDAVIWHDERIGYTKAINEGASLAKGEYLILMNDDVELLGQTKNTWLEMLELPFSEQRMAVTGPIIKHCETTAILFVLFFCAMIPRKIFELLCGLDEQFNPGFGEDIDFCARVAKHEYLIRAVPDQEYTFDAENKMYLSRFPIYHAGSKTVGAMAGYPDIVKRNSELLLKKYGKL